SQRPAGAPLSLEPDGTPRHPGRTRNRPAGTDPRSTERGGTVTRGGTLARSARACHCGGVLLRLLREPRTGRPGPFARLVALLVVIGLVSVAGPALFLVVEWFWRIVAGS
ncbi:MAG: hypothetical protein QG622_756, partial [Actinomycetota bacterium]|nr:hypothetical protein [Actinomycetota bacterium]